MLFGGLDAIHNLVVGLCGIWFFVLDLCWCSWCVGGVFGLECVVGVGYLFGGRFSGLC